MPEKEDSALGVSNPSSGVDSAATRAGESQSPFLGVVGARLGMRSRKNEGEAGGKFTGGPIEDFLVRDGVGCMTERTVVVDDFLAMERNVDKGLFLVISGTGSDGGMGRGQVGAGVGGGLSGSASHASICPVSRMTHPSFFFGVRNRLSPANRLGVTGA